jgi:hypothetical protein
MEWGVLPGVGESGGTLLPMPSPAEFSPGNVWWRRAIQSSSRNGISMFGTKHSLFGAEQGILVTQ